MPAVVFTGGGGGSGAAATATVVGNAVIVGHNIRFDLGFLRAACDRHEYPRLANNAVDTCGLARRLIRDEVRDCRLATHVAK